jgi:GNAT superfamily N-acetyltransferase
MTTVMMAQAPASPLPSPSDIALLRPAVTDIEAVMNMLSRCSKATLIHRFHGVTDGVAYFGSLLRDGPHNQTLLAWYRSTCVGVATLGAGATGIVDLGVLVEDVWQRRGVGSRLVESLLDHAWTEGVTTVHADVLCDDRFILEALRRIGLLTVSIEFGSFSIDIERSTQLCQSAEDRLPVELEIADPGSPFLTYRTMANRDAPKRSRWS